MCEGMLLGAREVTRSSSTGVTEGCEPPDMGTGNKLSPLAEHYALLTTEASFQALQFQFYLQEFQLQKEHVHS